MQGKRENSEKKYLFLEIKVRKGIKFKVQWDRKEGDFVKKNEIIGSYTIEGSTRKFQIHSPVSGVLENLEIESKNPTCIGIIEKCSHPKIVHGYCVDCKFCKHLQSFHGMCAECGGKVDK